MPKPKEHKDYKKIDAYHYCIKCGELYKKRKAKTYLYDQRKEVKFNSKHCPDCKRKLKIDSEDYCFLID